MKKYESVTLGIAFCSRKAFNEKFQNLLDEYSKKGWSLHSFQFSSGSICTVVFERE